MDPIVDLIRHAALLISRVSILPERFTALTGREQITELHTLIEKVQDHFKYEVDWTQARCSLLLGTTREDRITWLTTVAPFLAETIQENLRLKDIVSDNLPDVSSQDAFSIIMRLWSGCLAAARALRDKKVLNSGETKDITKEERTAEMKNVHLIATKDSIYSAGVPVGPYMIRCKHRPMLDTVNYTGISKQLQQRYFLDDIQEHPSSPGTWPLHVRKRRPS